MPAWGVSRYGAGSRSLPLDLPLVTLPLAMLGAGSRHCGARSRLPSLGGTVIPGFRYRQWLVRKSYVFRIPPQTLIPQVRKSA